MSTPIPTEDLPRALAEAMGAELRIGGSGQRYWWKDKGVWFVDKTFRPHLSHDHAQICVEECFKRGLGFKYAVSLSDIGVWEITEGCIEDRSCLATPEQKARAALKTLAEHRSK